jgi:hypothetical protein
LIIKDLESAHSWYQFIESQISSWRSLTLTLLVAYVGFLFTVEKTGSDVAFPVLLIPVPFFLLEIYSRAHLGFLGNNVKEIENIFMEQNQTIHVSARKLLG